MTRRVAAAEFKRELARRARLVEEYLGQPRFASRFAPEHLRQAVMSYVLRPGKRLRPALLMFACGATGGDETVALPAAAAVEIFHTWTLVHDDVIDNDTLRRGLPTVHEEAREWAREQFGCAPEQAAEYGRDIGILAGDVQHAWAVCLFLEAATVGGAGLDLVARLLYELESTVLNQVLAGEALDVQLSFRPFPEVSEEDVVAMMALKTAALLRFSAAAGAALGCGRFEGEDDRVAALAEFAHHCGLAFQLQDDILGLVGDEAKLGKPVGSDIREGKRTLIALHAYRNASPTQRRCFDRALGNRTAPVADIERCRILLEKLGGLEYGRRLARRHLAEAEQCLLRVPPSRYRDLLEVWAAGMLNRHR